MRTMILAACAALMMPLVAQEGTGSGTITSAKVGPGDSHTNNDGVTVTNNSERRNRDAYIDPAAGQTDDTTSVRVGTGATVVVDGLGADDNVDVGSSSKTTVNGAGGAVNISGGNSKVTVTNAGSPNTAIMTVRANGVTTTVPPGSSATFNT